jgi:hypothetical protein
MIITITALAVLLFVICFKSVEFFEKSKLWLHYLLHLLAFRLFGLCINQAGKILTK